jgi:uncharacterized membrane protein (UPF0127 family)
MTGMPQSIERPLMQALGALLLALWWPLAAAQTGPVEDLAKFPRHTLEIHAGKHQRLEFDVWLADNPRRQAQGLMFVRSLPPMRGMLFVYPEPKGLSMWMKNTYIPLDMLFIGADGRIAQIVANTTPHSLDLVQSKKPALAVLEIAAGESKRLGIEAGQLVRHPALPGP